jgi:hypothetical protein
MLLPLRLILLLALCSSLTSCGTFSHLLGQASGLVNSFTGPVLGALRLSDSPDLSPASKTEPVSRSHDIRPAPAKRAN